MNVLVLRAAGQIALWGSAIAAVVWFFSSLSQSTVLDPVDSMFINALVSLAYFVSGVVTWAVFVTLAEIAEDTAELLNSGVEEPNTPPSP